MRTLVVGLSIMGAVALSMAPLAHAGSKGGGKVKVQDISVTKYLDVCHVSCKNRSREWGCSSARPTRSKVIPRISGGEGRRHGDDPPSGWPQPPRGSPKSTPRALRSRQPVKAQPFPARRLLLKHFPKVRPVNCALHRERRSRVLFRDSRRRVNRDERRDRNNHREDQCEFWCHVLPSSRSGRRF